MREVTMYDAKNGSLHRTQRGADATNAAFKVEQWISERGIGRGGGWSADAILRVLLEDADILGPLLMTFVEKRQLAVGGRKS